MASHVCAWLRVPCERTSTDILRSLALAATLAVPALRIVNRAFWLIVALIVPLFAAEPTALMRAHAHNDYEHPRPLFDALDQGFGNVEADIYLVNGDLLVAHDPVDLDPSRTLESLYLAPLAARVKANNGSV